MSLPLSTTLCFDLLLDEMLSVKFEKEEEEEEEEEEEGQGWIICSAERFNDGGVKVGVGCCCCCCCGGIVARASLPASLGFLDKVVVA